MSYHNINMNQTDNVQVTFSQFADVTARVEFLPYAQLLYGFQRAKELKESGQPGQDHLAFCYNQNKLTFSVCDGVSQSFYGNLASKMLGDSLVNLMWQLPANVLESKQTLAEIVTGKLNQLCEEATDRLNQYPIPDYLLPIHQRVLVGKQKKTGSQTMFVAGRFDVRTNQLALCWMGDTAFRIWHQTRSPIDREELKFSNKQCWSTKTGLVGGLVNSLIIPLDSLSWLTIYTDGLKCYENCFDNRLGSESLQQMMTEMFVHPKNDDIAILQLHPLEPTSQFAPQLKVPHNLKPNQSDMLFWDKVPCADWYRVTLKNAKGEPLTFAVDNNEFGWQQINNFAEISVQAISKQALASEPAVFVLPSDHSSNHISLPSQRSSTSLPISQPPPVLVPQPQPTVGLSKSRSESKPYLLFILGLVGSFSIILGISLRLIDVNGDKQSITEHEVAISTSQQEKDILDITPDLNSIITIDPTPTLRKPSMPSFDSTTNIPEQANIVTATLTTSIPPTELPQTFEPPSEPISDSLINDIIPDHLNLQITTPNPAFRYDATFLYTETIEVCWSGNRLPIDQIKTLSLDISSLRQEKVLVPEESFESSCFSNFKTLSVGSHKIVLEAVFHNGKSLRSNEVIVRIK